MPAPLSRRAALGLSVGAGAAALAACGPSQTADPGAVATPRPTAAIDRSASQRRVRWASWESYLDWDSRTRTHPTLVDFERRTGLHASYAEVIDDNDTYDQKIQHRVSQGLDIGQDVVVFSDWMAGRYIRSGWAQQLDPVRMPNAKNLRPILLDVDYDPGRRHSLVWQSGFAVVAWDKHKVPRGIHSLNDLWAPELKGRVEVLSEMRDTMGLIMMSQGVDISKPFTDDQFDNALAVLQKQVDSGQIRQVKGNSYVSDLAAGDAYAVIGWSGDIFQLNRTHGDRFGVGFPESGGTYWSDNMIVPVGSPHLRNAERLMNYYYDPKVAARVEAYVQYVCPVEGAQHEMTKIDPALADSPWIFPDDTFLARTKIFRTLDPMTDQRYSTAFAQVVSF